MRPHSRHSERAKTAINLEANKRVHGKWVPDGAQSLDLFLTRPALKGSWYQGTGPVNDVSNDR
jgi:hypothetical protein